MASKANPKKTATEPEVLDAKPGITIEDGDRNAAETITFTRVKDNVLLDKAKALVGPIDLIVIDSPAMLQVAAEELAKIKASITALDNMRLTVSKPLHEAKVANDAIYREPVATLEASQRKLERAIVAYREEEQRKALADQRKAEEEAEAQRKALAAAAEEKSDEAATAAMSGNEEAAESLFQQAETLSTTAEVVTARHVDTAPTKMVGTSVSYRYGAKVPETNAQKIAAMKHIIDNPQFLNLVTFDSKAASQLAVALRDNFAMPGFELTKTPTVASRGVRGAESAF